VASVDLVEMARRRLGSRESLYYAPAIPARKAEAVRRTHAVHLPASEPLWVVYDATLFGRADEGFVITPERICWRNFLESPKQVEWRELDVSSIAVDDGSLRICGSRVFILFGGPTARALCSFLAEAAKAVQAVRGGPYRQGVSPDAPPSSGPFTDRQLLRVARRRLGDFSWLYFAPSIPERKRSRVRTVHAEHLPEDEEVLVVYDSTVFGSAEKGIALTRNRLLYKNTLDAPGQLPWATIDPNRVTAERETLVLAETRITLVGAAGNAGKFAALVRDVAARR